MRVIRFDRDEIETYSRCYFERVAWIYYCLELCKFSIHSMFHYLECVVKATYKSTNELRARARLFEISLVLPALNQTYVHFYQYRN